MKGDWVEWPGVAAAVMVLLIVGVPVLLTAFVVGVMWLIEIAGRLMPW